MVIDSFVCSSSALSLGVMLKGTYHRSTYAVGKDYGKLVTPLLFGFVEAAMKAGPPMSPPNRRNDSRLEVLAED